MKIGKHWCPRDEGVESLHVPPFSTIRLWVQPTEQHSIDDLTERCKADARIGLLNLRVNQRDIQVEV